MVVTVMVRVLPHLVFHNLLAAVAGAMVQMLLVLVLAVMELLTMVLEEMVNMMAKQVNPVSA